MDIRIDYDFLAWKKIIHERIPFYYAGNINSVVTIVDKYYGKNIEEISHSIGCTINNLTGNFSSILDFGDIIIAFTDRVRSYPVFYKIDSGEVAVSNSIYNLGGSDFDEISVSEIRSTKYVTGKATLYKNIFQLQAGECLIYSKLTLDYSIIKYERYFSDQVFDFNESRMLESLSSSVDSIFTRLVSDLNGREVWIPLSGGLDSRFILCKLLSYGYDRIKTLSYGPKGNHDAKWAKYVANKLSVPWEFINYSRKSSYNFFWSEKRKEYWKMASNGCTVPFMADEQAMHYLTEKYSATDYSDIVVINGQSGDFISGDHVCGNHLLELDPYKTYDSEIVVNAIILKHYGLNKGLNINNQDWIEGKIIDTIGLKPGRYTGELIAKYYELWEMSERQSKHVVNGQRSYDYYGIDWFLPLWEKEMVDFWKKVPYKYKINQNLYKKYLRSNNWFGLFDGFNPSVWQWQGVGMANIPIAKIIELVSGQNTKNKYYELAGYFGRYSHNYAPFGLMKHIRDIDIYGKNPWGRYADQLLLELKKGKNDD